MNVIDTRKQIQTLLGVESDGQLGKRSLAAFTALAEASADSPWPPTETASASNGVHSGLASSFADPADIRAFERCKSQGKSDQECFKVGDNGIGQWGDNTKEGSGACCAIQGHHMVEKWGSRDAAKHKDVMVTIHGQTHTIPVKDRLTDNLTTGAIIDLNPDACKLWNLIPPVLVPVEWKWV